jgi:hypothetical protein
LFSRPYWLLGWVGVREDDEGEVLHLVTLWRSTREEIRLYEENSLERASRFPRMASRGWPIVERTFPASSLVRARWCRPARIRCARSEGFSG